MRELLWENHASKSSRLQDTALFSAPRLTAAAKPGPPPKLPPAAQILELTGVRRVLQSQATPEMEVFSGLLPNGSIYNPHRGLRLFELAKQITPGAGEGGKGCR